MQQQTFILVRLALAFLILNSVSFVAAAESASVKNTQLSQAASGSSATGTTGGTSTTSPSTPPIPPSPTQNAVPPTTQTTPSSPSQNITPSSQSMPSTTQDTTSTAPTTTSTPSVLTTPNQESTVPMTTAPTSTIQNPSSTQTPMPASSQTTTTSPNSFTLPINVQNTAKQKTSLSVNIPQDFKPIGNYPQTNNSSQLMEFIPKEDKDPDNWTQIITIKSYPGLALKSNKDFLDEIVSGFKAHALKTNVVETEDTKQTGYEEGYRILSYTYDNRDEVVYVYTASGPMDTAMIQYAIKLNSPADLDKAKEQLKHFMKNNVTVH